MIFTIEEARNILKVDDEYSDPVIYQLLEAIPPYIQQTTGYTPQEGLYSPLAKTAARFILWQWFDGVDENTYKQQRVIDNLLKALSAER